MKAFTYTRALDAIGALLAASMLVVVLLQVFYRYALEDPLSWPDEIARLLFVWLIFIGTATAVRRQRHIRIDFIYEMLPRGAQVAVQGLQVVLLLGLGALMVRDGWLLVQTEMSQPSTALRFPIAYAVAPIPLCGALIILFVLANLVAAVRGRSGSDGKGGRGIGRVVG